MRTTAEATPIPSALSIASSMIVTTRREMESDLAEIWARLEWANPRIAFFGETNAGKSTLIETLRLLTGDARGTAGATIGDGRQDFTRTMSAYPCRAGGKHFILVDLPGIEGDESKVAAQIGDAVDSAHLVFYVTVDPRPPQTGDAKHPGTLEKIKSRLRARTSVWAIYNKKINSPRHLEGDLLDEDERRSLADGPHSLDGRLACELGSYYRGHVAVSALPAFLALAGDLSGEERLERLRTKFIASASAQALVAVSNIAELLDVLVAHVPDERAIETANLGKLKPTILSVAERLERFSDQEFGRPALALGSKLDGLAKDLGAIADDATKGMRRLVDEVAGGSVRRLRNEMLRAIDHGLSDDNAVTKRLDAAIDREKRRLGHVVGARVTSTATRIQASCHEALAVLGNRLRRDAAYDSPTFRATFSHAAKVKTEDGVDWTGLGSSALGLLVAAATATTGFGGVAIIAILGSLIGVANSLRSFFDPDFKKDQQRRSVHQNLGEAKLAIQTDLGNALAEAEAGLRDHVISILHAMRALQADFARASDLMDAAIYDMRNATSDDERLRAYCKAMGLDRNPLPGDKYPSTM